MATDFLISFDDLKAGSKAVKRLVQAFTRAGATVASSDIDPKTRRSSGVNYRQVLITFTDNQKVLLGVKTTGDIFEVRVNGAALAIKNQDDQIKAVGEIAKALDAGRAKFQAKMARTKVALPKGIATAAPRMEQRLQEAETTLDAEIAAVKAKITDLRAELGEPALDSVHTVAGEKFDGGEIDDLISMAKHGKVEDGDVVSKTGRDNLVKRGFVERGEGFNWLTEKGKEVAAAMDSVDADAAAAVAMDTAKPFSVEKISGTKALAQGAVNSEYWLIEILMEMGKISKPDAVKAAKYYLKHKLVKLDPIGGRGSFKHGAFLEPDVIKRAVTLDSADVSLLDAVDVPLATFDLPEVVEAQAIAARLAAGDTLDDADLSHARATLLVALDMVETNHPINLAEGNVEQAELEEKAAESFRAAIKMLESREPLAA